MCDVRFVNADGRAALLVAGQVFDLEKLSGGDIPRWPMEALVAHWDRILALHAGGAFEGGVPVESVLLGPPVPAPRAIYVIDGNYRSHPAEAGRSIGAIPAVFTKFPSSITGPHERIVLPQGEGTADWSAELAFVVGRGGRDIPARYARDYLRGFMIAQDISERFVQMAAGRQFSLGKSYDTFCPIGPAVVTLDELEDARRVELSCQLNGETVQRASTAEMITDVDHLVELLSSVMTLQPGDVCLTGTPAGAGYAMDPPRFLRAGDVICTEIEGLGQMVNACVDSADAGA